MKKRMIAMALSIAFSLSMGGAAYAHSYGYFDDDSCGSAVGCTSEFVGDVIAFPFRVVANTVDFIF